MTEPEDRNGIFRDARELDAVIGANRTDAPDGGAPSERFWVILYDEQSGLPPRVREVEAVRVSDASNQWMCRAVQSAASSWHRFDRSVLYEDQETAELEAAEALLSGELAHR